jgi:hypothetical protein
VNAQVPHGCWLEPDMAVWAVAVWRFHAAGGATPQSRATTQASCSVACGASTSLASRKLACPVFAALGCSGAFLVRLGLRHGK